MGGKGAVVSLLLSILTLLSPPHQIPQKSIPEIFKNMEKLEEHVVNLSGQIRRVEQGRGEGGGGVVEEYTALTGLAIDLDVDNPYQIVAIVELFLRIKEIGKAHGVKDGVSEAGELRQWLREIKPLLYKSE